MADNFDMKQFLMENKLGAYSRIKENKTAEDLFQMFKDEDLVNDRREYDEEDLMSTYPGLSEKEAEKLVNMLQNIDEKLAKEDIGGDIGDAEAEKMMDFLAEEEEEVEEAIDIHKVESADEKAQNLMRNISTNSNIPTLDKEGLISAIQELMDFIEDVGYEAEREEDGPVTDYSQRRASELSEESVRMFKSDNPEGDQLVLRFLKGIATKFDYPVQQAALFVKERIKKLGY